MKKKNSKAKQKKNQRIAFIIMDRNEKKEYSFRFFFEWSKKNGSNDTCAFEIEKKGNI